MTKPRARRPRPLQQTDDPHDVMTEPEPWGSHRYRYKLYLEIERRLAAMEPGWYEAQQKAPGLATGGFAGPDEPAWDDYSAYSED